MTTQAYIDDGCNESGYLAEDKGISEAIRFEFRPSLPLEVRTVLHQWSAISPEDKSKRINDFLAERIISWDLKNKGNILPITVAVMERIKQPVIDSIFNIVTFSGKSDEEIDQKQKKKDADQKN